MPQILLSEPLGQLFLGGLLAVARADGVVKPEEMVELRAIAARLEIPMPAEEDLLFGDEVTAGGLAAAIGGAVYRGPDGATIAQAFLEAALRMALADRELQGEEVDALRAFADALGVPTASIAGWDMVRRYG